VNVNIKQQINREMENYFNSDTRRVNHAHRVADYAEQLWKCEGGDYPVIIAAGLLHDIGIPEAERKYHSSSGKYQEIEGPPIAREILTKLGFPAEQIDEICEIIAHHHTPGIVSTMNFRILSDADWLVNIGDECDIENREKIEKIIEKVFLTASGRYLAGRIYLSP
jgi:HD superfamily phosphodiesterase